MLLYFLVRTVSSFLRYFISSGNTLRHVSLLSLNNISNNYRNTRLYVH